ncbi:MAG TPA: hypothetical protein ENN61_02535 [Bacteroidaceae bacterium]|nr:hypothetical protein [Bacteroidaceae bacterium]
MVSQREEMDKGIILHGFVPVRGEPSERSEMTSQVLFGESYDILEFNKEWSFIRLHFDDYQGWITNSAVSRLIQDDTPPDAQRIVIAQTAVVTREKTNQRVLLPAGSVTGITEKNDFNLNGELFRMAGPEQYIKPDPSNDLEPIIQQLISIPYLWGGRCGFGFDCSGLTQFLSRIKDVKLPRDSRQQAQKGININFMHETMQGDLAFFDNAEGEITHVGMILEGGRIVHASGYVRIDRIDQQGIFNVEKERYSHKLRVIKRPTFA